MTKQSLSLSLILHHSRSAQNIEAQSGLAAIQLIGIQAVITEYLIRYADELFREERDEEADELTSESMNSIESIAESSAEPKVGRAPSPTLDVVARRPHRPTRRCHSAS